MKKKCILGLLVLVSVSVFLIVFGLSTQLAEACEPCSEPTRIILVRHGQTHWNVLHILQGNADIPLDETGLAQTECIAQELADKDVDAVFSTQLSRAYDTALAIAAPHGLRVHKLNNMREIGVGIYTGHQGSQIPLETRIAWATNPDFALPSGVPDTTDLLEPQYVEDIWFEGESLNMVVERSWHAGVCNLARQHCGENVVVAIHGGIIKIALTQVYGLPVTDYSTFEVPNASLTVLEFKPDGSVVVLSDW
ncbi:MAG: histidine phosphatase family protein [Desulfobacula sp.]|nr:histidine phosphatase family protein [Desulfobacula sp.]